MKICPDSRRAFSLGVLGTLALIVSLLPAGGPNNVGPDAQVFRWNPGNPDRFPVKFTIDNGPLGALSRDEGAVLVRQGFQQWEAIDTATMAFEDLGFLEMDLTSENFSSFLSGQVRPENPFIFDDDGSIIDEVLGEGSNTTVLGFAGIRFLDPDNSEFQSGWAVFNGLRASMTGTFPQVMTHEIGHFIGLDHTQINRDLAFNTALTDDVFVPLMFPFLLAGGPGKPIRDDIAWVSWLYPEANFAANTGTIKGQVFRRSGSFFSGANVVAVQMTQNLDLSLNESREEVVSVVSDFQLTNDGAFELPGLTPGNYVVFIEPLDDRFVAGSNVGPFDPRFTGFEKDYYNGANESGTPSDDPTEKVIISVAAGQTVENIDLVSNDPLNRLDLLTDDSDILFEFPEGFSFPFFGEFYNQVSVNSDGNLTFERGDSVSTPRDEKRFLSGPPRVAPLFTDLDPGKAGEVKATVLNDQITFTWEDVPEFSEGVIRPGNRFSVTLFATGDIRFNYEAVDVTPDPDNIQAVIGLSPGSLSTGTPIDLGTQGVPVELADGPIYEVFQGTSFDLVGQEILFQAETSQLFFPFYQGDQDTFSGYAFTNTGSETANIQLEGLGNDGTLLVFPTNPQSQQIGPQQQVARLGSEYFGTNIGTVQSGWIRTAATPDVSSLFLFGNGLNGPQTKMDGSVAFNAQSQVLFFTRIHDGPSTFPTFDVLGPQDAETFLSIVNPNDEEITITLKLFGSTGQPIAVEVTRTLPVRGRLFERVSSIFNITFPLVDGYVRVDVVGPGAVGFAVIELADTTLGLNASFGNTQNTLYSAQLANGTSAGGSFFTSLKLVNTSNERRVLTLTAFRDDGSTILLVSNVTLDPNVSLQKSVSELFALGSPVLSEATAGSILIEADGPGVIGNVIFGEPVRIDFAAALPLQSARLTKAIFSQVANGRVNPQDPSSEMFTGLALFNRNSQNAQISIRVFDRDGNLAGETQITLGANQRISDLVDNLIPATADLLRGYIVVESTQPIVAQQLFGNNTLQMLSAVPPRILE